jgi:hypothetical protein
MFEATSTTIEASVFTRGGGFEPRVVPGLLVDTLDSLLCDATGQTFLDNGYAVVTLGEELFAFFAGRDAVCLTIPSDWVGYFGRPVEIRSDSRLIATEGTFELQIAGRSTTGKQIDLVPLEGEPCDHFFELEDGGVCGAAAWAEVLRREAADAH